MVVLVAVKNTAMGEEAWGEGAGKTGQGSGAVHARASLPRAPL